MSAETKTPQPPAKTPVADPLKSTTAADILSLLKALPPAEKDKVRAIGIPIPEFAEGSDPTKRVYSYLCKACGKLGLDFLGDKWQIKASDGSVTMLEEPPMGISIDRLATTQEPDEALAPFGPAPHRTKHPKEPRCRYCNQTMHLEHGGGIRIKGYLVYRDPWITAVVRELMSRRIRLRDFERENPRLFAHNVRPTGRLYESAGQPQLLPQAMAKS